MRGCSSWGQPPGHQRLRAVDAADQQTALRERSFFDEPPFEPEGTVKARAMGARGTNTEDSLNALGVRAVGRGRVMRLRSLAVVAALGAVTVIGCDGDDPLATRAAPLMSALQVDEAPCPLPVFDIEPSLVYDDLERLKTRFALRDVLDILIERAEVELPASSDELWGQWWRSNASLSPGEITDEPRCDVGTGADRNGFPILCDRPEVGFQDLPIETHEPVQLVNRFDLMPLDGSHCGEYRIVYALRNQLPGEGHNLIIFEGVLPNPQPGCGAAGCRPVVEFWAGLSAMTDADTIADDLREFYFSGLPEHDVVPVIRPEAYGVGASIATGYSGPTGQIRTNQFFHPGQTQSDWSLREYSLERTCTTVVKPVKPVLLTKKKKRTKKKKHHAQLTSAKQSIPVKPVTVTTCSLVVRPQPVANNPNQGSSTAPILNPLSSKPVATLKASSSARTALSRS
jgi:hypothetical protein